ncbi:hypothetical protein [Hyphomicrobium sp. LHD-15]|uniref:hypothetical protein n=1 Tax=Hyphomicrobium sp. LHD-15 TaxID=3072142 RepID=UPI0028107A84|nr:hypothetical protein [Hyphomicrobium sp. LHD-15]MDQ8697468.1 hypothetical protein [Hyphomicrobium sp. LHD-15]
MRNPVVGLVRFALIAVAAFVALGAAGAPMARAADEAPKTEPQATPEDAGKSEAATWDQAASIRGAAERLGRVHRTGGAKAAYELIDNCYRTHSIASNYTEGFESCIAQDYLETRTLIQVYSRMPTETLHKLGVPSPRELADSMGRRVSAAFHQYKKSQAYADQVRALVDQHGLPVFLSIVFPEAVKAIDGKNSKEKK